MNDMMSCLVMRPPSPVPETWERLMPCSRAILRTSGEERASSSSSFAAGVGGAADGTGAGAGAEAFLSSTFAGSRASPRGAQGPWLEPLRLRHRRRWFRQRCLLHRRAFGDFDVLQDAGGGRGNLGVDLVGGDFEQRFVALNFVAGLLQPLGNSAFDDGFAHLGHDDVSWHDFLPLRPIVLEGGPGATKYYSGCDRSCQASNRGAHPESLRAAFLPQVSIASVKVRLVLRSSDDRASSFLFFFVGSAAAPKLFSSIPARPAEACPSERGTS